MSRELDGSLADDLPLSSSEGSIIRAGRSAELDDLRALSSRGKDFIASFQAREIEATGIPSLKVGFNRVFGYYIEITNSHRDRVPSTYHRKQTLKNAERYITPELKDYEDRVLHAEEKAHRLEHELFLELRALAESRLDDLQVAADVIASLDVLQSLARVAVELDFRRPEIVDRDVLEIEEGRHPVLIATGSEPFVPNDTKLDQRQRVMLITGPNMAGKSTYIRQVALIVLMAQMGSWVPARRAKIGIVDQVFTRIGAADDLSRGASTFMVEMLEVANILNNVSTQSLVILDEVGRGTSTWDGLSLAWAVTEHLAAGQGVKTLFATHYHELTAINEEYENVVNYNVAVNERGDEIRFLHRIVEGATDRSYGIQVARLAGLPRPVLGRAREILGRLEAGEGPCAAVRGPAPEARQLGLFELAVPDPIRERLRGVVPDELSPRAALDLIYQLVKEAAAG